jgi:TIR domain
VSVEGPQPRIFISYRRDDSQGFARSIHDRLAQHFGPDAVFRDVNDIEPGRPWSEAIDYALASCDVFVLLIGRRWLEATDDEGNRRLDDPEDRHRKEIETAVSRRIRIFIALMEDAHMPRRKELPQGSPGEEPTGLQLVPALHALRIADHAFDYGIEELVTNIERATDQTHVSEGSQPHTAESRQRGAEELAGVEEERNHAAGERAEVTTDGEPAPTQPAERPPTVPVEPPARRREDLRAMPAEPPGPVTQPTQKAPAHPDGGGGRRRIGPAAVVVLVAAVAAVALGFVILSGGDGEPELEFEEMTTDDYQLEVPTGWNRIKDEESIDEGHLQTRLEDPSGAMLLGINHLPSNGLSSEAYVQQLEDQKLVEDDQYALREMDEAVAPTGEQGVYWEFDADQPQIEGEELSRVYAYVFDFSGTLYRIQCGAIVASGQADVAEEVARQAVDTLEVF